MKKNIRLDKFLADNGIGTRMEVKKLIGKGKVKINGVIIKKADVKVNVEKDTVEVNQQVVSHEEFCYYMLYKPEGCVTAIKDNQHKTVMDYMNIPRKSKLFPVGRLDKDTTGLLLITDDGELSHDLLSPKKHVEKEYIAIVDGKIEKEHIDKFKEGIVLQDFVAQPAILKILENTERGTKVSVTIREGKFHQIKRMFHHIGMEVIKLHRIRMGTLLLDENLTPGMNRKLTEEEVALLKRNKEK